MTTNSPQIKESTNKRPTNELADILNRYLSDYEKHHDIPLRHRNILRDIQICRTADCGGHIELCDHCDFERPIYNSCHNRHCPKCQGIARRRWVNDRLSELLPVPYYHVVFTLPHRLNTLALYNKRLIYDLFYQAAVYTLRKFGRDPKWLGAQLGYIGVLHTWGKGLCYHIHWHFIVPGGGLTEDGQWKSLPYNDKYLFDVKSVSKVVCARFIKLFKKAYFSNKIRIPDSQHHLTDPFMFECFMNDLASDEWINYTKRPFGSPEQVIKYIGRYTHRVAVSNHRIISIENNNILLSVKNYKNGGKQEIVVLSAYEFIRRYLHHILPKRFRKIRYGGFLACAVREEKLEIARQELKCTQEDNINNLAYFELFENENDPSDNKCPKCCIGIMRSIEIDSTELSYHWQIYMNSS